ncbi:MAG: hypothetical protein MUF27_15215 [Acidobacteria bacterium]|nr:hypothetical protein [Acidobacteriota bacterium]
MKPPVRNRVRPWIALLGALALAVTILAPYAHHHGLADEHAPCPVCQLASHHGALLVPPAEVPAPPSGAAALSPSADRTPGFAPHFVLPDPRGPPSA